MTVTSLVSSQTFPGNGAVTAFNFSFEIPEQGDEEVFITDPAGNITGPLASTLYTISGYGSSAGGVLNYPLTGSPLASNYQITLARALSETQEVVLDNQGPYFPSAVEQALDRLMMVIQQVSGLQGRALAVPVVDPTPLPLPAVEQRALQLLGFDASGNPIAAQPSSAAVSSAMAPVVAAASIALARTALGLGGMATEGIGAGIQNDGAGNARINFTTYDDAVSVNPVPASHHMTRRDATGPITYTAGRANTYWNGFGFWISAVSGGPITVAIDAHDSFIGHPAGEAYVILPGQLAFITTDGESSGTWYVDISGQAAGTVIGANAQTGVNYTIKQSDWTKAVLRSNAAAMADTLPQATGSFGAGFWFYYQNIGQTACVITPATSTINGAATFFLPPGYGVVIMSDGSNWQVLGNLPTTGRVLLNTLTANNSANLSDTSSFTSLFRNYELVFENLIPAAGANTAQLLVHSGGAFPGTVYLSSGNVAVPGGTNTLGSITSHIPCGYPANVGAVAPGISGRIMVSNPLQTAARKMWFGQFSHQATSGPAVASIGGYWDGGNGAVDGFEFLMASGNIASGSIRVYGWN